MRMHKVKNNNIVLLEQGLTTAFIDGSISSNLAYKPQFISNNYKEGRKVISSIEDELLSCEEFCISVAFITMGGITPLLQTLKELEQRGIPGKILTTDYLTFSDPRALKTLAKLNNIQIKMYMSEKSQEGFHTKGYIFKKDEMYQVIVGSSNMTMNALTINKEWNTRIVSTEQGEYTKEILREFEDLWDSEYSLEYEQFIELYSERYKLIKEQQKIARSKQVPSIEEYKLKPNSMQVGFINNLRKIYEAGEDKALLISATGEDIIMMTSQKASIYGACGMSFLFMPKAGQGKTWQNAREMIINIVFLSWYIVGWKIKLQENIPLIHTPWNGMIIVII